MNKKIDSTLTDVVNNSEALHDNLNTLIKTVEEDIPVEDCDRHNREVRMLNRVKSHLNEIINDLMELNLENIVGNK